MALITCPECGKQISDKANKCIHCGFPLDFNKNNQVEIGSDRKILRDKQVLLKRSKSAPSTIAFSIIVILTISGVCIFFLLKPYKSALNYKTREAETQNGQIQIDQSGSESETRQPPKENKSTNEDRIADTEGRIADGIVTNTYYWYEDGSAASISFQPEGNSSVGTMVLKGTILTLEYRFEGDRNAIDYVLNPDQICSFVYKYNIRGNYIHATFVSSSCSYQAKDRTFTFYESDNTICAYTSQGEMVFKP